MLFIRIVTAVVITVTLPSSFDAIPVVAWELVAIAVCGDWN